MRNIISFFFLSLFLISCSNESDSAPGSFFNLHQGNLWVYKIYTTNDNINYTFNNGIDSVRVVADTLINNLSYAKLEHKSNTSMGQTEYLRVDSDGHLVTNNGIILHPGNNYPFQNVRDYFVGGLVNVGSIAEELSEPFTTNVEGTNYFVYSYNGIFTPLNTSFSSSQLFYQYQDGLGLVCQHIPAASGLSSIEYRLVHYELN